jgi:glycosyltransferase involved in cell wall biosynthesis
MKILYLASAGGSAMRRSLRAALSRTAAEHERRMLAPDAEAKALRDCGVRTESWRPAGLFNVLRSINVLRRAVDRFEPDAIHAFGWTAASVAMGALPGRYARRTLVTLADPIRKNELPKAFLEKRLPELLARSWAVECAYETLRRVLVDTLGTPADKVRVVPYGVAVPAAVADVGRPAGRPGPIIGYAGRLESDSAWETVVDALSRLRAGYPEAQLRLGRTGPVAGLVRAHARSVGVADAVTFLDDLPIAEFFAGIDMLAVPSTFDGLPYALVEALVAGLPVIGADSGGIADTLAPFAGWLVPDTPVGFAAGMSEAWSDIDAAWDAAQAQRPIAAARFDAEIIERGLLDSYTRMAREPTVPAPPVVLEANR